MEPIKPPSAGTARLKTVMIVMVLCALSLAAGAIVCRLSAARAVAAGPDFPEPLGENRASGLLPSLIMEDRLSDVAEAAMPSVVNVFTKKTVKQTPFSNPDDPFFHFFFGPGMNQMPRERKEQSLGSGVIVSHDGYVLTNNHVVESADEIKVALSDKREFNAKVVGTDPKTDLAVLKIEARDLPVIRFADSDKVRVGQVVLAIGNPFGLSRTVTMGIVSARGRDRVGITDYEDFIQTDAAINPGNSGGALINLQGELIGVNTAIFSRSGGYMGIGFAVPTNLAKHIMDSLIEHGSVVRGWLGVAIQELTPDLAKALDLDELAGALVAEVFKGSPADKAGIAAGDVVVTLDGSSIKDFSDLRKIISDKAPGTDVKVRLIRDGKNKTLSVKLEKMPSDEEEKTIARKSDDSGRPDLAGMKVAELTPQLANRLDIESDVKGVVVVDVESGSRADQAGIMVGDIIFRVNRKMVENLQDFKDAARHDGGGLLLHIRRRGANLFIAIPEK